MKSSLAVSHRYDSHAEWAVIAEDVERVAWQDIVSAAPAWLRASTGVRVESHGDVLLLAASRLDSLLFNRVIGLGEWAPATDAQIKVLIERYRALQIGHFWIHVGPYAKATGVDRQLRSNGLQPYRRSWVKMMCRVWQEPAPDTPICIRNADVADAATVASIVGPAFDLPQNGAELFTMLIDRPRWRVLVAEIDGEPVATAGLYLQNDVAYLAFGATRAEWRRHGAQQALMARMAAAAQAGCQWIVSETGFPLVADEPNPSFQNLLRAGLRPIALRDNYAPPGTLWDHGAAFE